MTIAFGTQYENATGSSGTSIAKTGVVYASGDYVLVFVEYIVLGGATDVSSVTDGTNTYTKLANYSSSWGVAAFYCKNPTPGTYTVTATLNGTATFGCGVVIEVITGGDNTINATLISGKTDDPASTSTDALTSASVAPSQQPAFLMSYQWADQSGSGPAAGTGTTLTTTPANVEANLASARIGYKRVTSTSSTDLKYTSASANRQLSIGAIVYEASAASPSKRMMTLGVG